MFYLKTKKNILIFTLIASAVVFSACHFGTDESFELSIKDTTKDTAFVIGFFGWKLIMVFYPHYAEIQQGFTYNGHSYIAAFACISIALCFFLYRKEAEKEEKKSFYVGPLFLWLIFRKNQFLTFPFPLSNVGLLFGFSNLYFLKFFQIYS